MSLLLVLLSFILIIVLTIILSFISPDSPDSGGSFLYEDDDEKDKDSILDSLNKSRVAINQRTRGALGAWKDIGVVHSQSVEDNTVFNLTARSIDRGRYTYEYKITNQETGVTIELFDGDEVDELEDGDTVDIPGYEGLGTFVVLLNSKD